MERPIVKGSLEGKIPRKRSLPQRTYQHVAEYKVEKRDPYRWTDVMMICRIKEEDFMYGAENGTERTDETFTT